MKKKERVHLGLGVNRRASITKAVSRMKAALIALTVRSASKQNGSYNLCRRGNGRCIGISCHRIPTSMRTAQMGSGWSPCFHNAGTAKTSRPLIISLACNLPTQVTTVDTVWRLQCFDQPDYSRDSRRSITVQEPRRRTRSLKH